MSKIYIVTTGEYSEYHIESVFIDPEAAEKFCAVRSGVDRDIFR